MLAALVRSLWQRATTPRVLTGPGPHRLNLGCGVHVLPGWINLDSRRVPGVDVIADLDACRHRPLPFPNDSIDEFQARHVLEHIADPLALMQELHRIARPGAKCVFRVPYGSSDDADQDPTHVKRYFQRSFFYFSQLGYRTFDYGYRGDWDTDSIVLTVDAAQHAGRSFDELSALVRTQRNIVFEMIATLSAVKPARKPGSVPPPPMRVEFQHIDTGGLPPI